mgnify:CR=1 FL=1
MASLFHLLRLWRSFGYLLQVTKSARNYSVEEIINGKMEVGEENPCQVMKHALPSPSCPPLPGNWTALSRQVLFSSGKQMGAGKILRREDSSVIFAAYRVIFNCNNALETEIHALMQAMAMAIQHTDEPMMVQSNSSKAL